MRPVFLPLLPFLLWTVHAGAQPRVPFEPTPMPVVQAMVDLAAVKAGDVVYDLGCGDGRVVIAAVRAGAARGVCVDVDPQRIAESRENAERAGVADRVRFEVAKASEYPREGYDLICFFDCLHDMGHPDRALRHAAAALAPGGTVMLVEPYANDRVEENINPIGRLYYAASTTICTAHAISENGTHALGAQAGEARLAELARASGFSRVRRALQTPFNLILEVRR